MSKDYPQESELRAMPLLERLEHAARVAMVEDKETIELAINRIKALEAMCLSAGYNDEQIQAGTPYIECMGT